MLRYCAILLLLAACVPDTKVAAADAGFGDGAPLGQGSAARGPLVVNEVSPKPESGADWIELYNRSTEVLDLCDFFVTDSLDRLDHYHHLGGAPFPDSCEERALPAGSYLVVYADDRLSKGDDHAPFRLGLADEVHIVSTAGEAIDSLVYLHERENIGLSLARQPNGEGAFFVSGPSMGEANR